MTARYVLGCGEERIHISMVRIYSSCCARAADSSATVTFDAGSQGQLAAVIYEWGDVDYLGKDTSKSGELPVSVHRLPAVHLLNAHYIAEDLCLHVQRAEERLLQQLATRPLHHRLARGQVHQRHQLLVSTGGLLSGQLYRLGWLGSLCQRLLGQPRRQPNTP